MGDLVSSLEKAKAHEHSAAQVLPDISKSFDGPPYTSIVCALPSRRDHGLPMAYLRAFLRYRAMRVRV